MSNPKVGTTECIKLHHRPFQCLLPIDVEEVKPGDLLEMANIYWPNKAALNRHTPYHKEDKKRQRLNWRNQTQRTRAYMRSELPMSCI